MKTIIMYSIYDKRAEIHDTPFFATGDLFAERHFRMLADDRRSMVHHFIECFEVRKVALYDKITGEVTPVQAETIYTGKDIKREWEQQ